MYTQMHYCHASQEFKIHLYISSNVRKTKTLGPVSAIKNRLTPDTKDKEESNMSSTYAMLCVMLTS